MTPRVRGPSQLPGAAATGGYERFNASDRFDATRTIQSGWAECPSHGRRRPHLSSHVEALMLGRGCRVDHSTVIGFTSFAATQDTLAGIKLMHMTQKRSIVFTSLHTKICHGVRVCHGLVPPPEVRVYIRCQQK